MEFEAVDEGTIGKLLIDEGTEGVKVNSPIAVLLEDGEDASAVDTASSTATADDAGDKAAAPAAVPAEPATLAVAPAPVVSNASRIHSFALRQLIYIFDLFQDNEF